MPKISVIIPIYNVSEWLDRCLESLADQTFNDFEAILVNDGSTDDSAEIAQKFADRDTRFRLINQKNAGPAAARNAGLDLTKTPFVTFVDADDWIVRDYLEKLIQPVEQNPEIDLVCGGYFELNKFHPQGLPLHDFEKFKPKSIIGSDEFISNIFNGVTGVLWSKLFKTGIIRTHQLRLPKNLKFSEDLIFVLQYSKLINKAALVFEPAYYYNRLNETGISQRFDETLFLNFKEFNLLMKNELKNDSGIEEILNKRTGQHLLKMLKDQNTTKQNLKKSYLNIISNFDKSVFDFKKSKTDDLFLRLLNRKLFGLAFLQERIIKFLRNIKNA